MWLSRNSRSCQLGMCWIEVGAVAGNVCYSSYNLPNCGPSMVVGPTLFWGDNRPNGEGYADHFGSPSPSATGETASILYAGGGSWWVNEGDSQGNSASGASTYNMTSGNVGIVGTEVGNPFVHGTFSCSQQSYLNENGQGWSYSSPNQADPGTFAYTSNGNFWQTDGASWNGSTC